VVVTEGKIKMKFPRIFFRFSQDWRSKRVFDRQNTTLKHYKTMAPTEESILRSFLLSKSGLRDVVTLSEFTSFFPPSKRSSPLVRQLYRDLQGQRNAICESVGKQINMECRMGARLIASRRAARADVNGSGEEGGMEAHVSLELVKMLMSSSY